jgi:hypothetical protein
MTQRARFHSSNKRQKSGRVKVEVAEKGKHRRQFGGEASHVHLAGGQPLGRRRSLLLDAAAVVH